MKPIVLVVEFVYMHEPDPAYWSLPVEKVLRAEVTIDAASEPDAVPLDKAVWQDALGPELAFGGVESPHWIGAKEAGCDAALEQLSRQATRESDDMARAS